MQIILSKKYLRLIILYRNDNAHVLCQKKNDNAHVCLFPKIMIIIILLTFNVFNAVNYVVN